MFILWLASRSINSFLLISASHEKVEVPKFAIRIQSIVMFLVFVAMLIGGVLVATLIYRFVNASLLPMLATCDYGAGVHDDVSLAVLS